MKTGKSFYAGFRTALFSAEPGHVPDGFPKDAAHRFAIYRNNVHRGLIDALAAAYSTVEKLVGAAFFARLARDFMMSECQRPGSLALYGAGFADFITAYEAAQSVGYLADIAQLERARLEALHARDAVPLAAQDLVATHEAGMGQMVFSPHPACRLVVSDHPIGSIWHVQNPKDAPDAGPGEIIDRGEAVLLTRPKMVVEMQVLVPDEACFCRALLQGGQTVEAAVEAASKLNPAFDITRNFANLLLRGALSAVSFKGIPDGK